MKKTDVAVSFLVLFTVSISCGCHRHESPPRATGTSLGILSTINGNQYEFSVTEELLGGSPAYSPEQTPPLTISEAVRLAELAAPQYFSGNGDWASWTIHDVTLRKSWITNKWFYIVTFVAPAKAMSEGMLSEEALRIPVLLNGQAVEGKKGRFQYGDGRVR